MSTLNALDPTPEQIKAFLSHKKAGEPVYMLNLLKFKNRATYKAVSYTHLTLPTIYSV